MSIIHSCSLVRKALMKPSGLTACPCNIMVPINQNNLINYEQADEENKFVFREASIECTPEHSNVQHCTGSAFDRTLTHGEPKKLLSFSISNDHHLFVWFEFSYTYKASINQEDLFKCYTHRDPRFFFSCLFWSTSKASLLIESVLFQVGDLLLLKGVQSDLGHGDELLLSTSDRINGWSIPRRWECTERAVFTRVGTWTESVNKVERALFTLGRPNGSI